MATHKINKITILIFSILMLGVNLCFSFPSLETDQNTNRKLKVLLVASEDENLDSIFNVIEEEPETDNSLPDVIPDEMMTDDESSLSIESTSAESPILSIDGDIRNETAYRLSDPHHFSKIKNILNVKTYEDVSDSVSFVLGGRFSYDAVFDLTDEYNDEVEDDQRLMADLRDAYFDIGLGNFDLRLGNQQIVWGQAVGLFFADIVNPKDLKEFILPELEQIRIPVPAANLEYYKDNYYFQAVFIPFPEFNEFGEPGSEFNFLKSLYEQDADIILKNASEPANTLENSEIGFRISKMADGWDMSLFYFYDYYNSPVNYRSVAANLPGSEQPVTITYLPEYERVNRFGSTFSKAYGDAIIKGEFIYSDTMFFSSSDISVSDGIEKSDTLDWLLGVDYTFYNTLETNFQLMQYVIFDHSSSMMQDRFSTYFSVWMRTGFFEDRLEPELFFITSLNQSDCMIRPKVTYSHNDNLRLILGVDLFYGESDGDFGAFEDNDRVFVEMIYTF